ncbi:hypothetical protein FDECE_4301 [Fusarium decemcellulare]|nr:hypothetical protein FDECE_4301 [Fusarium decemcellulare]
MTLPPASGPLPWIQCSSNSPFPRPWQPEVVQYFVDSYHSNFRSWLLFSKGTLDRLCDRYKPGLSFTETPNASITDDQDLLQLPFIVSLGLMAAMQRPLSELRSEAQNEDSIASLQLWIAESLDKISATSCITLSRVRTFLLAALHFQYQLDNHQASEYFDKATAIFQQYLCNWRHLDELAEKLPPSHYLDIVLINLAFFNFKFPNRLARHNVFTFSPSPDESLVRSLFGGDAFDILSTREDCVKFKKKTVELENFGILCGSQSEFSQFLKSLKDLAMPASLGTVVMDLSPHLSLQCFQSLADVCHPHLTAYEKAQDPHRGDKHRGTTPDLAECVKVFARFTVASIRASQGMPAIERRRHLELEELNLCRLAQPCIWGLHDKEEWIDLAGKTIDTFKLEEPTDRSGRQAGSFPAQDIPDAGKFAP